MVHRAPEPPTETTWIECKHHKYYTIVNNLAQIDFSIESNIFEIRHLLTEILECRDWIMDRL